MKKAFSLLLIFVLLISVLPMAVNAADTDVADSGLVLDPYSHLPIIATGVDDTIVWNVRRGEDGYILIFDSKDSSKDCYINSRGYQYGTGLSVGPWMTYMSNVSEIVIRTGITEIGEYSFRSNESTISRYYKYYGKIKLTMYDVETIGQGAFYQTGIGTIVFRDTISSIGDDAFTGKLQDVYYEGTPTDWGKVSGINNITRNINNMHYCIGGDVYINSPNDPIIVGDRLTVDYSGMVAKIPSAYRYETWLRSFDWGETWEEIAETNSYTVTTADAGSWICVRVEGRYMENSSLQKLEGELFSVVWEVGEIPPVYYVAITGITEPVAGAAPNVDCTIPANSGYKTSMEQYGEVTWYTEDGDIMSPYTDKFIAGKKYTARVTLFTIDGYEFADKAELTGTINGYDATKSIFIAKAKQRIYISRVFTCPAASTGNTVSGTVTSFLNASDGVTVRLVKRTDSSTFFSRTVYGNSASFSFSNVPSGLYTLTASKKNHVTRSYTVAVSGNTSGLAVKIHPLGDINGDGEITTRDYSKAFSHVTGTKELTGYELACADVAGSTPGELTSRDLSAIFSHLTDTKRLW